MISIEDICEALDVEMANLPYVRENYVQVIAARYKAMEYKAMSLSATLDAWRKK